MADKDAVFDPAEFAAFKKANAAPAKPASETEFDPKEFEAFKQALNPAPPPKPPLTLMDMARKAATAAPEAGMTLGKGIGAGLMGEAPPGGNLGQIGGVIGQHPGLAAGSAAASLTGTLPAALAIGGTVGAGAEGYRQIAARIMGGKPPETPKDAFQQMVSEGLSVMGGELGGQAVKGIGKIIKGITPDLAQSMLKMPAESVRRVIEKASQGIDILPKGGGGAAAKEMIERKAINALQGAQRAVSEARNEAGMAVGKALEKLQADTKGAKIFDVGSVAKNIRSYMEDTFKTLDPTVAEIAKGDVGKINKILNTMEERQVPVSGLVTPSGAPAVAKTQSAFRDAATVNRIKQEIQAMSDFTQRGLPQMESDFGQQTLKQMGREIRLMIEDMGNKVGSTALKEANSAAKAVYDAYDEIRPMLATSKTDPYTLLRKTNALAGDFNAGGLRKALVTDIAKNFPKAAGHIENLFDALAARAFTQDAAFTPSSSVVGLIRSIITPRNLGKAVKAAPAIGKTTGGAARLGSALAATPDVRERLAHDLLMAKAGMPPETAP